MKTIADELMERGEEKGLEKGLEKGRKEELVDTLKFFLEKKFGELPDELIEKIESSSIEDLKKVKRSFFDIESLDEVNDILS